MALRQEWRWNEGFGGYDGVHTYDGKLCWYTFSNNTLAGGGSSHQSYKSFIAKGPSVNGAPPEILAEVTAAVEKEIERLAEKSRNRKE